MRPARCGAVVDRLLGRLGVVPRDGVQAPGRDRRLDGHPGPGVAACRRHADGVLVDEPDRARRHALGARPAADIPAAAQTLLASAQASSGCPTPVIALNELAGQDSPTPWSAVHRRLSRERPRPRHGVGARRCEARSCSCPARPTRRTSREMPQPGGGSSRPCRTSCSRSTRRRRRSLGRCPARVARAARLVPHGAVVVPGDQRARGPARPDARLPVGPGKAGREGLQPTDSWLEVVKLEALAAREVAGRARGCDRLVMGLGDVRLGRGRRRQGARRLHLPVDARSVPVRPALPGRLRLRRVPRRGADRARRRRPVHRRQQRTRSRRRRSTAWRRSCAAGRRRPAHCSCATSCAGARPPSCRSRRAEAAIVYARFAGSRARYVAALAKRGATPDVGRAALADGLRLQAVEGGLHVPAPTAAAVRAWRKAHGGTRVRLVRSSIPLAWLGNSRTGIALPGSDAPPQVLRARSGQTLRVPTAKGIAHITVGAALPLREAAGCRREPRGLGADPRCGTRRGRCEVARRCREQGARDRDLPARPASAGGAAGHRDAHAVPPPASLSEAGGANASRWWSSGGLPRAGPPPPPASWVLAASTGAASCPRR